MGETVFVLQRGSVLELSRYVFSRPTLPQYSNVFFSLV